jgi:GTP-binding protein
VRQDIENLVNWYFFVSGIKQKKVILIIDAKVGPTKDDLEILEALEAHGKYILIVANKVDKIKKADYAKQIVKIKDIIGYHQIVYCSAEKKIGLIEILKNLE